MVIDIAGVRVNTDHVVTLEIGLSPEYYGALSEWSSYGRLRPESEKAPDLKDYSAVQITLSNGRELFIRNQTLDQVERMLWR